MKLEYRDIEKFKVIDVSGNIELKDSLEFEKALDQLIDQGHVHLILNFSNANYISSNAIATLVATWKKALEVKGSVRAVSQKSEISQELITACIDTIMPVYESEEALRRDILKKEDQELSFPERFVGRYTIIDVTQPISILSGYKEVDQKISRLLSKGRRYVGLNLWYIEQIYSEMVGLITKWSMEVKNAGGDFCLVNLTKEMGQRLAIMGVDKVVSMYDSEEQIDTPQRPA